VTKLQLNMSQLDTSQDTELILNSSLEGPANIGVIFLGCANSAVLILDKPMKCM